MNNTVKHSTPAPTGAVVPLAPRPRPRDAGAWYAEPVAGIPFLLRNLIVLQRAGAKRLIVYADPQNLPSPGADRLRHGIENDPRLTVPLHWATGPAELAPLLEGTGFWLIAASGALHKKTDIEQAFEKAQPSSGAGQPGQPDPDRIVQKVLFMARGEGEAAPEDGGSGPGYTVLLQGDPEFRIGDRHDFARLGDRLLRSSGLSNDSFMDRWVTRYFSQFLTRVFLLTPLTPNQITFISLVMGLASAVLFFQGGYTMMLAGAILLQLSAWVDCTDGEIARLRFQESPFGGELDIIADNIVHFAVFFGIGMGLYFETGNWIYKALGGAAVFGSMVCFGIISARVIENKKAAGQGISRTGTDAPQDPSLVDDLANRDFTYLLLFLAAIGHTWIFITLTGIGSNIFALLLILQRHRARRE